MHDKEDKFKAFKYVLEMYENVRDVNDNVVEPLLVEESHRDHLFKERVPYPEWEGWNTVIERISYFDTLNQFLISAKQMKRN